MWPQRGDALSRTIEAEAAVEGLFAEALRRWAPDAAAAVIPQLTGTLVNGDPALIAAATPPNPAAMTQAQSVWDQHAEEIILAGLGVLWAVAVYETATDLGAAAVDAVTPDLSTVVIAVVLAHMLLKRRDVEAAVGYVDSIPYLSAARDDFLAERRPAIQAAPQIVQAKLEARLTAVTSEVIAEDRPEVLRVQAAEVLEPGSLELRAVAREEGYQAAGVMNHAVMSAAQQRNAELPEDEREELEAVWLATLDGRTRPTHWAVWGSRVPLGTAFTVGGEQLRFPGDPAGSAKETKNCRCRLGILAKGEPLPDEFDPHTERLDGRDSTARNRDGRTQAEEIERRRKAGNIRARDNDGIGRVAAGGWGAPSEQEQQMTTAIAEPTTDGDTFLTFTDALFAVTGTPTSDRRMLAADIDLTFRDTPLPLQWCEKSKGGHDESVTIGVIESLSYTDGQVRASGYLLNNEHAVKAFDLMSHGVANPSVDLGGEFEMFETYADGTRVTEDNFDPTQPVYRTITRAEVLAATIVAIPAFGETRISLNAEREPRDRAALVAAAFQPRVYDPEMFADPKLKGGTRLTITDDGHIVGHIANWRDLHRSIGLGNITPPRSQTGYEHFHTSPAVQLSDGTQLSVGRLTVGVGHAPVRGVSAAAAQAHYDNVDTCWAIGRIGEDAHGIWFSGVAAPWASPEKVEMGLASPLSGDWRPIGPRNSLELVAVLSVNTPGFLCKVDTDNTGRPLAMVASMSPALDAELVGETVTLADIKAAVAEGVAEAQRNAEALAQRSDELLERARATVADDPAVTERVEALLLDAQLVEVFADRSRMPAQLKKFWLSGEGAARIRWNTPGAFARCVREINAEVVEDGQAPLPPNKINGLCANLYKAATGRHPGRKKG